MLTGHRLLRVLRKQRGKSQERVAEDVGISYKCLSELERGITCQPPRELLEAVLKVLNGYKPVSMEEQRLVYIGFGYSPPCPLPMTDEIDEACQHWRAEYSNTPFPAYLSDVSQRLLAWNAAALRLVGLHPRDRRVWQFERATTIDLAFGLAQRFVEIENIEAYRHSFVGTLKRELRPYEAEDWYDRCIATAQRRYPDFKRLWEMAHPPPVSPVGCPIPLRMRLPQMAPSAGQTFTFRRDKAPFIGDPRFQTMLWLPDDAATWRAWNDLDFW